MQHTTFVPVDRGRQALQASGLPPEMMEEVRPRVGFLALLLFAAFAIDPAVYIGAWIFATLANTTVPLAPVTSPVAITHAAALVASAIVWWAARTPRIQVGTVFTLGLGYEIAMCFVIAYTTTLQYYNDHGLIPFLTWVPALVIFFPLILPGPPRRMLGSSIVAAAMSPLALFVLDATGKVVAQPGHYVDLVISSTFAVCCAYASARVVHRMGKEVAAARELGSYRLEERLGEGGMGEVWRARHRMLARPAAVKLIRSSGSGPTEGLASPEAVQRFEHEAQVIARLRSPHTVELFDFGVASNGAFYYAMELLDGFDADALIRRFGPMPPERAVHVLRQVCHSLSEADSYGLVHRDIKPANIFLCRYGEDYDFVKVLDFGLVKALDRKDSQDLVRTGKNTVQGTPAFIAPEQAMGETNLDGRVDIYATGCVAYWLLTGQLVFTADNLLALLRQHTNTPPAPPSSRTALPMPAALDQLVLACLAKDPAERPQSARELSRRLSEIDVGQPWTDDRARDWWERHQLVQQ